MRAAVIAQDAGKARTQRRVSQAGSLYIAVISTVGVGFVTSVLTTRLLGPEEYGNMKFVGNVFQFFAIISTLGIFTTGSQLLARFRGTAGVKRELTGALFAAALLLSAAFVLVSAGFAALEAPVFGNGLGWYFILFSPILVVSIIEPCVENILQGENRIHELSLYRLLPGIVYMVLLIGVSVLFRLTLAWALLLQLVAGAAVAAGFTLRLRPDLGGIRKFGRTIWKSNKRYGWRVYHGVLTGVATTYLSTFMISYYLDNTHVGYFGLAMTLTLPLVQLSSVVGTTYFRDFANVPALPGKVTFMTVGAAVLSLPVFILLVRPVVIFAYTEKFGPVASLAAVMAYGAVFYGLGDYFNRFLGAHRRGKDLRNGAIAVGIVNILGYALLVRFYGVDGAALTRVLGGAAYCGMMVRSYVRFRRGFPEGLFARRRNGKAAANPPAPADLDGSIREGLNPVREYTDSSEGGTP